MTQLRHGHLQGDGAGAPVGQYRLADFGEGVGQLAVGFSIALGEEELPEGRGLQGFFHVGVHGLGVHGEMGGSGSVLRKSRIARFDGVVGRVQTFP